MHCFMKEKGEIQVCRVGNYYCFLTLLTFINPTHISYSNVPFKLCNFLCVFTLHVWFILFLKKMFGLFLILLATKSILKDSRSWSHLLSIYIRYNYYFFEQIRYKYLIVRCLNFFYIWNIILFSKILHNIMMPSLLVMNLYFLYKYLW